MPSDENDWSIAYPISIVEWLCDVMEATEDHFTPGQILADEREFPGLWNNLSIVRWQRRLIGEQEGKNNG